LCLNTLGEVQRAARLFHKLGALLYFDNLKELKDFVILDIQWLFEVMATLFTTKHRWVKEHGILNIESLSQIWKNYPIEIHKKLLSLITKFQIAFPVMDKEKLSFLFDRKASDGSDSGVVLSNQHMTKKNVIQALFIPALLHKQVSRNFPLLFAIFISLIILILPNRLVQMKKSSVTSVFLFLRAIYIFSDLFGLLICLLDCL
jgi:hypothetical protein